MIRVWEYEKWKEKRVGSPDAEGRIRGVQGGDASPRPVKGALGPPWNSELSHFSNLKLKSLLFGIEGLRGAPQTNV